MQFVVALALHGMALNGMPQHGMVLHGMVLHGMGRTGSTWHGMAWLLGRADGDGAHPYICVGFRVEVVAWCHTVE